MELRWEDLAILIGGLAPVIAVAAVIISQEVTKIGSSSSYSLEAPSPQGEQWFRRRESYPHFTAEQFREVERRIFEITDYLGLPRPFIEIVGSRAEEKPLDPAYHDVDVLLLFNPRETERMTTYRGWFAQEGQIKEAIVDILKFRKLNYVNDIDMDVFVAWK